MYSVDKHWPCVIQISIYILQREKFVTVFVINISICIWCGKEELCHNDVLLNALTFREVIKVSVCFNLYQLFDLIDVTELVIFDDMKRSSSIKEQRVGDKCKRNCCYWQHDHFRLFWTGTNTNIWYKTLCFLVFLLTVVCLNQSKMRWVRGSRSNVKGVGKK